MPLTFHKYLLRLHHTFKTAHSQRDAQVVFITEWQEGGISGYGETTVNTYFRVDEEMLRTQLTRAAEVLQDFHPARPEDTYARLEAHPDIGTFARCAVDEAVYDWYGKKNGLTTRKYLGAEGEPPLTDYTIGLAPPDEMVAKLKAFPWPVYKIKLGTEDDLRIVRELRQHTDAVFRIDANCGWTAAEALEKIRELAGLGVELIEQPLDPDDREGMRTLYRESPLPLIADESCLTEDDVERCAGYFHGINIKLTKCGGLTPAVRMVKKARQLGMKVMGGCMNESSVGISALAQLAPLLDYLDADGILLIANDPARGVMLDNGRVIYNRGMGNGVELLEQEAYEL